MALKTILTVGSLLAALIVGQASLVQAQAIHLPGARFEHRKLEQSDETLPMATPGIFDYDAQVFAPVEFVNDKQMEPRVGFYLSYDKTYLSLTGTPQFTGGGFSNSAGNDFTWGSRYNFGWFSENEAGWSATYQSNNGITFPSGIDGLTGANVLVDTAYSSIELNRMFRQSTSNGSVLEPYLGLRYFAIGDETFNDNATDAGVDQRFRQKATNSAIGFQAGARRSRRSGKWRFTTDGAIVAAYNQQRYTAFDISTTPLSSIQSSAQDQSFVPALDLEFDIAYNVTRDITLRTGVQLHYLWNGITRANSIDSINNPNSFFDNGGLATLGDDTRFIAAGFVFGFEWRR